MFLYALLMASVTMSAVILLVLFLNKVLANKVSAVFRYYVWLIIIIGLLIPFRPNIQVPFAPIELPIFEAEDISGPVDGYIQNIERSNEAQSFEMQQGSPVILDTVPDIVPAAERMGIPYTLILFGIWGIGVLAVLAFHLRLYYKFVFSVRRWGVEIKDSRILYALRLVIDDMKLNVNQVQVKSCAFISSPLLIGFRSPTILLPESEIPTDELEHIFKHELTHYKRRDLWMNLLVLFVSAMHWFNPFVYLLARAIRIDCEVACDEAVIANNDMDKQRHYGEAIIGFIGTKSTMTPVLSTYFYGGSKSMKKRLASIMNASQKGKGLAVICAIMVIGAVLLSSTVFAATSISNGTSKYIDEAKAKTIALEHAGLNESQVTFIKAHLDRDDGRDVYDVEFYSGNTEYDYEIDAATGTILEYDREIEHYSIPSNSPKPSAQPPASDNTGEYIGETKAKSIALPAAGLSENQISRMEVKLDREDGKMVYEIEFNNGRTEYDYEIDAISGAILKSDIDYDD